MPSSISPSLQTTHVVVLVNMVGVSAPPTINVNVNAVAPPPRKPLSWAWLRLFVASAWHWVGAAWHTLAA